VEHLKDDFLDLQIVEISAALVPTANLCRGMLRVFNGSKIFDLTKNVTNSCTNMHAAEVSNQILWPRFMVSNLASQKNMLPELPQNGSMEVNGIDQM